MNEDFKFYHVVPVSGLSSIPLVVLVIALPYPPSSDLPRMQCWKIPLGFRYSTLEFSLLKIIVYTEHGVAKGNRLSVV